jgi:hypothetical protein
MTPSWLDGSSPAPGLRLASVLDEDFLPKALAAGQFVAALDPHVVGSGLESVLPHLTVIFHRTGTPSERTAKRLIGRDNIRILR